MKNSLSDLNNYLFERLERLADDEVCCNEQSTKQEIERTDAILGVAQLIIANGRTQIEAIKVAAECDLKKSELPALLEVKK